MGHMSLGRGRVTPAFAKSVQDANADIAAAQTATTDAAFRKASRAVGNALDQQKDDYSHYKNQMNYVDALNGMAYPTEAEKQAQDDQLFTIEKLNAESEIDAAKDGITEANDGTNKNKGFENAAAATAEADAAMGPTSTLGAEVQNDIDAETSTLNAPDMDKTTGNTAEMTDVSNVAAAVENMSVKVASAAQEAESA